MRLILLGLTLLFAISCSTPAIKRSAEVSSRTERPEPPPKSKIPKASPEAVFTTEENSNSNLVRFVSFNNSEQVDFKGDIKEISLNQFLEDEVFSDVSLSD